MVRVLGLSVPQMPRLNDALSCSLHQDGMLGSNGTFTYKG